MITITKETITIECDKKLFRAFNEFDTPRKKKLTISIEKVNRIHLQTYEVLIVPVTSLYERYRNLFHDTRYMSFWDVVEEKTLIFVLDDYEDITREGIDKLLTGIPLKQPGLWQIVCKIDYFAPLCVLYKVLIERFNQQEVTPGAEQSESL
ncbi:MAG: hypothetical protein GY757_47435 [bacterium]|nr:hypothetical protein [bacterium]